METLLKLLLVIFLVLLNGFFVASEFALVAVRKTRINELVKKGRRRAKLVQFALNDLQSFISATQLGITIASLALGWVGEPAIADLLRPYFQFLPDNAATFSSHTVSVILAFSFITFLHIVLGEVAPKTMALEKSEKVALWIIAPLTLFTKIFQPLIFLLSGAGDLVLKLFGFKTTPGHNLTYSEEEIKMILRHSVEGGAIEKEEAEMISSIFKLGDVSVGQIMVNRGHIVAFDVEITISEMLKQIERYPHSRFPIYRKSIDNVLGFIHIKDIYKILLRGETDKKLAETKIRTIFTVPESKKVNEVLEDIQNKKVHIAIVKNKQRKTVGLIALEDILERLVGEIPDEFEQLRNQIKSQAKKPA
ncbi:hypothetical protein A3G67_02640 [Candidatus Roizmanbacteria bacterium RIFCSPLOWO2_12_FULL_40_12]|uniref:Hemolysin n=1 Tax=Candidatus Roizmanbacteria bacterium RIFCSPLOWO2_01_FULL_40_42 TaxID=1802066 RepID=A0A1F7J628_9BACT|nr:MAG: hypothetical protein A2779_03930 [Candidatus Roizmanbacteria bacterium RIFCSPHIGHO2_01_FULL_40_98]OGK28649.1 MAG: hypothetical protein A3C31_01490 [Candidatus Roizmanbacteria bacterium RIFCSPHIGHO2_02_FULL_40_53]OGK29431.1 MAG: hypothetical protein A2W49_04260 [Candidatus Roizmanbacteria bacterium RIFCSPHIGHO2_12_41_18]OGK36633.1 MAG: hypothetical protein A3E69_00160 [Candidatus Roizmanbacteria bacterium RIFCSPHIGHO2_12_FULL_40_130]OGK51072.1 MAG: hypothetical protein A3B50_02815 [Candi